MKPDFACASHVGLVREHNEDSYLAAPELGLWIVADGMGGYEAGEVASSIAIHVMAEAIRRGEHLAAAIESAHRAIQAAAATGVGSPEMGSTVVALKIDGWHYEIAWLGDSRAYLWNGQGLRRLTKDHSYVQMLVDAGLIEADEMSTHPARNIITQGLGVGGTDGAAIRVEQTNGTLTTGDTLLLCSDGLSNEVSDAAMAALLERNPVPRSSAERLVKAALAAGGRDNVTVIVVASSMSS